MKIRAAVAHGQNRPLVIEELELDPPGAGEVLVRMTHAGLCHSDMMFIDGSRAWDDYPMVLGHEGAGIVEQCGAGVQSVRPGDHVILAAIPECGTCPSCRSGRTNLCDEYYVTGQQRNFQLHGKRIAAFCDLGCFAEAAIVREMQVTKIRADAPLGTVCCIGCAGATGLGSAAFAAKVEPGSSVIVFGLGGIGLNVVAGARIRQARQIVGVDTNPAKRAMALKAGATDFVNPREVAGDLPAHLRALTQGGADYCFECVGHAALLEQAILASRPGWGTTVTIGILPGDAQMHIHQRALLPGRKLMGALLGNVKSRSEMPLLVDWYMEGKVPLDDMITHRIRLEDINEGFRMLGAGEAIRSVIGF